MLGECECFVLGVVHGRKEWTGGGVVGTAMCLPNFALMGFSSILHISRL